MAQENKANASILALNGLRYTMPAPLSTTLIRTHKKQFSQRTSYTPGSTIVFDLNVSGFIDPELSYMKFSVQAVGADAGFGSTGSACNLFRDIRIQSKTGVELDRIQHLNEYSVYRVNYTQDVDKNTEIAGLTGQANGSAAVTAAAPVDFLLPMSWLSGLYRPSVKGQMIPPHLIAGARIEIQLETFSRALVSAGATTDYVLTNPVIVHMEHALNDNTLKAITSESQTGLEYAYPRVFSTQESSANATFNHQIKKAVSQATEIFTAVHPTVGQNAIAVDSFLSIVSPPASSSFQYRLGSSYFPHQVVQSNAEAYMISKQGWKNSKEDGVATASFANWTTNGLYCVGVPLKTDHSISSSGVAINNSATLELTFTQTAVDKTYYSFLTYTALIKAFLSSVVAKI